MTTTRWDHHALTLIPTELPAVDLSADHGEVFTRRWVVEMILDLAGYTADRDLTQLRLVEPSCGQGAFLAVVAERVAVSALQHGRQTADLLDAVRAFDLLGPHVETAKAVVTATLINHGIDSPGAHTIAEAWVHEDDFLLMDFEPHAVDVVVGNPPYIRLEDVPAARSAAYRRTWQTMGGRADIFVGFFERGLRSLRSDGKLAFICADRWMRNQYGRDLRELIVRRFAVDVVVSMHDVDAFEDEVSAYPAVTVISNKTQSAVLVADTTARFGATQARDLVAYARGDVGEPPQSDAYKVASLPHWFEGSTSWPQGSPERLAMLEYLTDKFPALEDRRTGTKVGIGVATGADKTFIVKDPPDVEPDRLLPMAMVRDLATGKLKWSGHYLISPWQEDGLVSLNEYPRLAAYYLAKQDALKRRHVASKNAVGWYRTIDRVDVSLTARPKLLIPDMRMSIHPVLDEGQTYPHHNLYHVTSERWDLRVLGGLLLSHVANAFVEAYAVKMRGGTLRFQAQYLRRIRVPELASVSAEDADALAQAFDRRDVEAATAVALRLYGLDHLPE